MRKDRNLGMLLSAAFLSGGTFLLHEAVTSSEWYRDIYLIAGATISAVGLVAGGWPTLDPLDHSWVAHPCGFVSCKGGAAFR